MSEKRLAVVERALRGAIANIEDPESPLVTKTARAILARLSEPGADAPRPEGLDVERLARALEVTGHVGNAHILTLGIDPGEHDDDGCLFRPESLKDATAIAAEYARLSDTGDTP